jgi:hypothetical protein
VSRVSTLLRVTRVVHHARVWIGCGLVRVRVRFLCVCGSCLFLCVLDCRGRAIGESPHLFDEGPTDTLGMCVDFHRTVPELVLPVPPCAGHPELATWRLSLPPERGYNHSQSQLV